jgi:hypothetical protein
MNLLPEKGNAHRTKILIQTKPPVDYHARLQPVNVSGANRRASSELRLLPKRALRRLSPRSCPAVIRPKGNGRTTRRFRPTSTRWMAVSTSKCTAAYGARWGRCARQCRRQTFERLRHYRPKRASSQKACVPRIASLGITSIAPQATSHFRAANTLRTIPRATTSSATHTPKSSECIRPVKKKRWRRLARRHRSFASYWS